MIPIGTVCYLTGDHSRAGQCCTTVSGLKHGLVHSRGRVVETDFYCIELSTGERMDPADLCFWCSQPHNLIPIAPPGLTTDEDKRIPVAA